MDTTQRTSTPVDSPLRQRSEAVHYLPPMDEIGIVEFYRLIDTDPPASVQVEEGTYGGGSQQDQQVLKEQTEPRATEQVTNQAHAFGTIDAFVDVLESCLKCLRKNVLKAVKFGSFAPARHPNATKARPDIVIFREEYSLKPKEDNVFWSSIEMPIQFHSAGKSREQRVEQAVSYVSDLLRARPDLVSAFGLLVEVNSLDFFICNINGIKKLSLSNAHDYLPLLSAIVKYLNDGQTKNRDSTLSRGTPMFIARAVQAGKPLPPSRGMCFPELPPLSERIERAYKSNYPKRMELFKEKLSVQMKPWGADRAPGVFQHKLEHDGESGVWSAFWWALLAFPDQAESIPIDASIWTELMPNYNTSGFPEEDNRAKVLYSLFLGCGNIFHPRYGDLLGLFQDIAEAMMSDYHWAEPGARQLSDYVHEILQRIILNFIVKNMDEPFMDLKKADKNRTVQRRGSTLYLSTSEVDHRRVSLLESLPVSRKSSKRKTQETLPNPTPPKHTMSGGNEPSDSDTADEDAQRIAKKARIGDV
ncbi:hypothetical protein Agabi119p4_11022 [Agaricus bisporus var. burnettii]|uniref:Fungal-type protein kinase domain-containing protein n=1 Tax=Agaricus bisporus var. burnettii TaxID=192524 RepID=A0A8H7EVT1_AGABI|nr:hypothetical protein Agabi119p4_11022 [Agaricus bisporus var. burnettii]